jgi:mRNA interferase HigB
MKPAVDAIIKAVDATDPRKADMHVISIKPLREFWESRPGDPLAEGLMRGWYKTACIVEWANFAKLKQTFPSADLVGDCVVFDVGGNHYRVVAKVRYGSPGIVYVKKVMDHKEYDKNQWPAQCGCGRAGSPKKPRTEKPSLPKEKPGGGGRKKGR